jgi:hypothetical protein
MRRGGLCGQCGCEKGVIRRRKRGEGGCERWRSSAARARGRARRARWLRLCVLRARDVGRRGAGGCEPRAPRGGTRIACEARLLRAAVAVHGLNVAWVLRQRTFSNSMKSMISSRLLFRRLTRCDGVARLRASSERLRASSARMRTSSSRSMARAHSSSGSRQTGVRRAGQPAAAGRGRAAPCAIAAGLYHHQSPPADRLLSNANLAHLPSLAAAMDRPAPANVPPAERSSGRPCRTA